MGYASFGRATRLDTDGPGGCHTDRTIRAAHHYRPRTERAYACRITPFVLSHGTRHLDQPGAHGVTRFFPMNQVTPGPCSVEEPLAMSRSRMRSSAESLRHRLYESVLATRSPHTCSRTATTSGISLDHRDLSTLMNYPHGRRRSGGH